MQSDFLKNLKTAVEEGNFNSEAAKKVIDTNESANKSTKESREKYINAVNAIIKNKKNENISEEEISAINSNYEIEMKNIKEKDLALQQIKLLNEIEETIKLSIHDMFDFINQIEESFDKSEKNYNNLFTEIEKNKTKYSNLL